MALIIDGYNLLHASGIMGRGIGPGGLERSRQALLNFLAESLDEAELGRTTVVFDARDAPPGLPRRNQFRAMTVLFAEPGADADSLIEQLILDDSSPRKLTVVSSDHRLHRAARRRRATAVDSDRWYGETLRARIENVRRTAPVARREGPISEDEAAWWLRQFGLGANNAQSAAEQPPHNPFPPGYAEDIRDDET